MFCRMKEGMIELSDGSVVFCIQPLVKCKYAFLYIFVICDRGVELAV